MTPILCNVKAVLTCNGKYDEPYRVLYTIGRSGNWNHFLGRLSSKSVSGLLKGRAHLHPPISRGLYKSLLRKAIESKSYDTNRTYSS